MIAEGYLYQKSSQDKYFAAKAPFFVMNRAKNRRGVDSVVGTTHGKVPVHELSSSTKDEQFDEADFHAT